MTLFCDHCDFTTTHALALRSHEGSLPCKARSATLEMTGREYKVMHQAAWAEVLLDFGIGEYVRSKYAPAGPGQKAKRSELHLDFWAPAWIVTLLEDGVFLTETYKGMGLSEVIQEWLTHNPELPR